MRECNKEDTSVGCHMVGSTEVEVPLVLEGHRQKIGSEVLLAPASSRNGGPLSRRIPAVWRRKPMVAGLVQQEDAPKDPAVQATCGWTETMGCREWASLSWGSGCCHCYSPCSCGPRACPVSHATGDCRPRSRCWSRPQGAPRTAAWCAGRRSN